MMVAVLAAIFDQSLARTNALKNVVSAAANAVAAVVGGATTIEDPHSRVLAYSQAHGADAHDREQLGTHSGSRGRVRPPVGRVLGRPRFSLIRRRSAQR